DATELLGVDMQQVAGMRMLVTEHRLARLQISPPRQPGSPENPAHRALRQAKASRNARLREEAPAQLDDGQRRRRRDHSRADVWPRRRIAQTRLALAQIATHPLTNRGHAHAVPRRRCSVAQLAFEHVLDHFQSTRKGESGILVNVHPAELLKDAEWVAPSSLSDSA